MNISIVIPVYKNEELFKKNLLINMPYFKDLEIIIVNDDPSHSIEQTLSLWPHITLIENKKNIGFAGTVHTGILQAKGEIVLLLNTDVILKDTSYLSAINHFQNNKELFAVSFAQVEKNNEIVGKNIFFWKNGFIQHSKAPDLSFGFNGWAEGGSCMIDKSKYLELNGFDTIYSPFYWEDIDLSYRAWKSGYTILFDPSILVEHHHESTIGSFFSKNYITTIAYRNQLLFIWKNITDETLRHEHTTALIKQLIKSLLLDIPFVLGYIKATIRFFMMKPQKKQVQYIHTDHEILSKFK